MNYSSILTVIVAAIMIAGCKNNTGNREGLIATEWQLKEIKINDEMVSLSQRVPTIAFTDTNRVFGFSGCNRFMGKYEVEKNQITIDPGASTMMACRDMELERKFIKALREMKTYSVVENELTLKSSDEKSSLIFIPKVEEVIVEEEAFNIKNIPDSTVYSYQGSEENSKLIQQLSVTFFPSQEKAVVHYRDNKYDLTQKPAASGIWYEGENVELRGKGEEITVTLPDGKVFTMNQVK